MISVLTWVSAHLNFIGKPVKGAGLALTSVPWQKDHRSGFRPEWIPPLPQQIQDLLNRLQTSDVRILAVSLTGDLRNPPPAPTKKKTPSPKAAFTSQQFAEADLLLRQIAQTTGGQAYFPANSTELPTVFAHIAQIVRHEFSLAFVPPTRDGAIHSLEVRVDSVSGQPAESPDYRVDCRRAYLAPAPTTP